MKTLKLKQKQVGPVVINKRGVKFAYLESKVTSTGGGTYLTRALDARNKTDADVIVFILPASENAYRNVERIKRGREDLMLAVKPLILPFKIVAVIGATKQSLMEHYENVDWSDIKY